jgi:hypothetical protein
VSTSGLTLRRRGWDQGYRGPPKDGPYTEYEYLPPPPDRPHAASVTSDALLPGPPDVEMSRNEEGTQRRHSDADDGHNSPVDPRNITFGRYGREDSPPRSRRRRSRSRGLDDGWLSDGCSDDWYEDKRRRGSRSTREDTHRSRSRHWDDRDSRAQDATDTLIIRVSALTAFPEFACEAQSVNAQNTVAYLHPMCGCRQELNDLLFT